jgi:transposase
MGVVVSEPTMCRVLKHVLHLTRKRKTRAAYRKYRPANLQRIKDFELWQEDRDAGRIVFIDEMGIRAAEAERNYARSRAGEKAVMPGASHCTGERGMKWNFLAAMNIDGMLDCTYATHGKVNSETFENWCEIMLIPAVLDAYPDGGASVVLDNASFHRRGVLGPMFIEHDIELVFLPAYSPEYNPIETAFAWIKGFVRRTPTQSIADIPGATFRAFQGITPRHCASWFRFSNYTVA